MKYDHIMVRFGELSTKGKNKKDFIRLLAKNIKNALSVFQNLEYIVQFDHIYIKLNEIESDEIIEILKDIPGIHSFSLVYKTDSDIENLKKISLELIKEENKKTFKIKTRRANKRYPIISDEVNRIIASNILANTSYSVDVHNPDILMSIEIRDEATYISTKTILGAGGYPGGSGAKILHMLSGGIDSPVAMYLLLKRGLKVECIHFASPPYTNIGVIEKLKDLLGQLNKYQETIKLTIVPFTKIQEKIYEISDESYAITIMRRMMYRLADIIAKKHRAYGLSNGESIGQVASQTLESISVINEVTNMPILRPLITYDKEEIIKISRKINCFDISIRPFEDCCTIFAPKNPKTKPSLEKVKEYENKFDFDSLIKDAVENVEIIYIKKNRDLI